MKKTIFVLLILTGIFVGCKKYEEGPCFSMRSAYGRLGNNPHVLIKYTVNGEDSLGLYNDSLSLDFDFQYHYDEVEKMNLCLIGTSRKDGSWSQLTWHWKLINNNKTLKVFESIGCLGTGPFGNNKTPEWEILRLTHKEIKMKTNFNQKNSSRLCLGVKIC